MIGHTDERHDVASYPDVALATLSYMKTLSKSWENFVVPPLAYLSLPRDTIIKNYGKFITEDGLLKITDATENFFTEIGKDLEANRVAFQPEERKQLV